MPPSALAGWTAAADRPDPVDLLLGQATTRIPELVPVRHGRMSASPLAFFRGGALIMAADLAPLPLSGITVQVCGDAHLMNFGLYASPERDLLFDINDFDETLAGAWEWDLMRLSASLVVAARSRSFSGHQARHAVLEAVRTYRERMVEYAGMRAIDVYYARVDGSAIVEFANKRARPYLQSTIHAAAHHDALHELPKITTLTDGRRRIVDHPPHHHAPRRAGSARSGGRAGQLSRQPAGRPARPARPLSDRGRRAARSWVSAASAWVPS